MYKVLWIFVNLILLALFFIWPFSVTKNTKIRLPPTTLECILKNQAVNGHVKLAKFWRALRILRIRTANYSWSGYNTFSGACLLQVTGMCNSLCWPKTLSQIQSHVGRACKILRQMPVNSCISSRAHVDNWLSVIIQVKFQIFTAHWYTRRDKAEFETGEIMRFSWKKMYLISENWYDFIQEI